MAQRIGRLFATLSLDLSAFETGFTRAQKTLNRFSRRLGGIGKTLSIGVSAPIAALGTLAAKSAIDFESTFAGVRKTVDGTAEQMQALRQDILDMESVMPVAATEINRVAATAGQLGVKAQDVAGFTQVMLKLGEAAEDLDAETAAFSIAKFTNVTGLAADKVPNLASAITFLGNNTATTEGSIVELSRRIAGAGKVLGLSEAEMVGFSAAISSVGVQAEAGGTAISKIFQKIQVAASEGGRDLQLIAKLAGKTADEFKAALQKDAAGAVTDLIQGLGEFKEAGGDVFAVLNRLGVDGARVGRVLLSLSGAGDLLNNTLEDSRKAFEENNALNREYAIRTSTTASAFRLLRNQVVGLLREFGETMLPIIRVGIEFFKDLTQKLRGASEATQRMVIGIAAATAAFGPLLAAIGTLAALITITPLGALIAGLIAATGAIVAFKIATSDTAGEIDNLSKRIDLLRINEKLGDPTAARRIAKLREQMRLLIQENLDQHIADASKRFGEQKIVIGEHTATIQLLTTTVEALRRAKEQLIAAGFDPESQAVTEVNQRLIFHIDQLQLLKDKSIDAAAGQEILAGTLEKIRPLLDEINAELERTIEQKTPWERWEEQAKLSFENIQQAFVGFLDFSVNTFSRGIASMIVQGKNFGEIMKGVLASIAEAGIAALVKLGLQWVITTLLGIAQGTLQHTVRMGQLAAQTFGGAFAATAAIPVIGPAIAGPAATGALSAMIAGAAGAFALGSALGATQSLAEGGLVMRPTLAMVGDVPGGEAVIPLRDIMTSRREQHLHLHIDSLELAHEVIPHMPDVVHMRVGPGR